MTVSWSDDPITSKFEDEFARAPYAVHSAKRIVANHSWDHSIVFGLTGPWGSGKTSMLAMIAEEITATCKDWRIARFTPWASSDVTGLLADFYTSLSSALPKRRGKQVRSALSTLAQISAPTANAIPWVGGAIAIAATRAGDALAKYPSWDIAFRKAVHELKELETPLIVIADDIDRLQKDELLALLKVVRLLGRFPGVHYLLSYDEGTLYRTLNQGSPGDDRDGTAIRFMEKIVQYQLVVPPLPPEQCLARLTDGLNATFREVGRADLDMQRIMNLKDVYLNQLSTPRAIDRYLSQLRHHLPLLEAREINDDDIAVLTLLRIAFPALYSRLPFWRHQLVTGHTIHFDHGVEWKPFDVLEALEEIPQQSRSDAQTLLLDLFPVLKSKSSDDKARPQQAINNRDYFGRYFSMGIPPHDISDTEVSEAADGVQSGDSSKLIEMLTQGPADRIALAVRKMRKYIAENNADGEGDSFYVTLLQAVYPLLSNIPETPYFLANPSSDVSEWIVSMLSNIRNKDSVASVVRIFRNSPSLFHQIALLYRQEQEPGKTPIWMNAVVADISLQVLEALIEHLRSQDSAPNREGPALMIHFLESHNQLGPFSEAIAFGIDVGDFTIADVAARFVTTGSPIETRKLNGFNQASFNLVAPSSPDTWYQSEVTVVNELDLSWANRRAYAAGRTKRPSRTELLLDPHLSRRKRRFESAREYR